MKNGSDHTQIDADFTSECVIHEGCSGGGERLLPEGF